MKNIIFSLIPLLVILSSAEIVLRYVGFQYSDTPSIVVTNRKTFKFKYHSVAERIVYATSKNLPYFYQKKVIKDKQLQWNLVNDFQKYHSIEKEPGVIRIVALGCSVTQACHTFLGQTSYPYFMQKILDGESKSKYEVINAGVSAYTSYQGLQQLKRDVVKYRPDLITISFGLNDMLSSHTPDKSLRIKSDMEAHLIIFFEGFRVYQAYHALIATVKDFLGRSMKKPVIMRVSLEDYRDNLNEMIDIASEHGIRPVLISAFVDYEVADISPGTYIHSLFPVSGEKAMELHRQYNGLVREVAARRDVALIDLMEVLAPLLETNEKAYHQITTDGGHLSVYGCKVIAEMLVSELRRLDLL